MDMNTNFTNLKQQFQHYGVKYTAQRQAIVDTILEHPGLHMSSEEIHGILRRKYPEMGLATVYRTLLLLEKMKLVRRTDLGDGCMRYEILSREGHAHHHLICSRCGAVVDMEDDLLEELEKRIYQKNRFIVDNHSVKFYGRCEKCID